MAARKDSYEKIIKSGNKSSCRKLESVERVEFIWLQGGVGAIFHLVRGKQP